MSLSNADTEIIDEPSFATRMLRMLWADKFALCAAIFLVVIVVLAFVGPAWLGDLATKQNLRGRNLPRSTGSANGISGWGRMRSAAHFSHASSPPRKIR